jgi:hypothetical protein
MRTDRKLPWISVQDVGAIAAKAFANPDEYLGRVLPLASDAHVSLRIFCRKSYS